MLELEATLVTADEVAALLALELDELKNTIRIRIIKSKMEVECCSR